MIAHSLLSPSVPALAADDTAGRALYRMAELGVEHLPVVGTDGRLLALVSEADLHTLPSPETPLAAVAFGEPVSVAPDTHAFDAAHLMLRHDLSALPVVGAGGVYLGAVARPDLFRQLAHMLATEEAGAIVVAEAPRRDFSLARLAYMVEQSDVRVLSASVEDDPDAGLARATLKLNVADTARVRALMEHEGYRVAAVFDEADADLQGRVDAFLRYLEV
jgi:acetoin utilization protein AcuB